MTSININGHRGVVIAVESEQLMKKISEEYSDILVAEK